MDIIVTTPKSEMENAAREAAEAIAAGGGLYFRRFRFPIPVCKNDRVYYVENGFVRGYAIVDHTKEIRNYQKCDTTGRFWSPGFYIYMRAETWKWINPIPMRGFQQYRAANNPAIGRDQLRLGGDEYAAVEVVGGWTDPRPQVAGKQQTMMYKQRNTR